MEGLKENLISISQIFDNKGLVKFTHNKCIVYDSLENIIVKGMRLENNHFCVGNPPDDMCNKLSLSTEDLWH